MVDKQIHIENPCPMSLNKMKTADGFYCKSCSKTIIDFRNKPVNDIINVDSDITCGIFSEEQVSTPTFSFKYKILFRVLTILSIIGFNVKPVYAQDTQTTKDSVINQSDSLKVLIKGKVILNKLPNDTVVATEKPKRKWFRKKKKIADRTSIGCPSF